MNWSNYQENIFSYVLDTKYNLAVSAVAGSGKTTTLVEIINNLVGKTLFSAFNKHIAMELQSRIGDLADAKTLHSAGMGLLYKVRKPRLDEKKYFAIIREVAKSEFHKSHLQIVVKVTKKILSMTMNTLTQPEDFEAMLMTYGFLTDILELNKRLKYGTPDALTQKLKQIIYVSIAKGIEDFEKTGEIDYNDMIFIPVVKELKGNYKNVLIDEAQDLNAGQMQLALGLSNNRIIAVADPKQAIMGFTGSLADSFDQVVDKTNAQILPLSVCYRCPTSHLELAQAIVPHIEPAPNASKGEIYNVKTEEVLSLAQQGDLIICRRNAPLIKLALKFIANKRQARVRGRDFATDLMNLADIVKDHSVIVGNFKSGMLSNLTYYFQDKVQILAQYDNNEPLIEALSDRCNCLQTIVESSKATDVETLKQEINDLFSDEKAAIYLSSVHRAKGLEADNVFLIQYNKIRITYKGQQVWQQEQEANLEYVALTRAKKKLYLVNDK